jgi:hypothetical protein
MHIAYVIVLCVHLHVYYSTGTVHAVLSVHDVYTHCTCAGPQTALNLPAERPLVTVIANGTAK